MTYKIRRTVSALKAMCYGQEQPDNGLPDMVTLARAERGRRGEAHCKLLASVVRLVIVK
jgi:hypothetical protein